MDNLLTQLKLLRFTPIIVYLILIILISLLAISSAIPLIDMQYPNPESYVIRQIIFYTLGTLVAFFVVLIGNERMRALRWWIYGFVLIFLLGLILKKMGLPIPLAKEVNGTYGWYELPGIGTIQPAEFMKIAIVLVVSDIIQRHNELHPHHLRTFKTDFNLLLKIILAIAPPTALILAQTDSGITMIILFFVALMIFASGIKWRYIVSVLLVIVIGGGGFLILVSSNPEFLINNLGVQPYQLSRFYGWFDPFGNIQGLGYQLVNGLVAIGSGNLIGNGFQSMTHYFPEAHTDFIFAVIGMDFGLLGTSLVVGLCLLFDFEILNVATLNRNFFNSYVCVGIFGMLFFQQFQNIGMTIGLLPITGITLPLISYGGSSSISYMILFALVLNGFIEGSQIKHSEIDYHEKTLYLKTKPYLKEKFLPKNDKAN